MKRTIVFLLILSILIGNICFAELKEGQVGIKIETFQNALDNLRVSKEDYQKRKDNDLVSGIIYPALGVLEIILASGANNSTSASLYAVSGVIFVMAGAYYLFYDLPETSKKIDSINKVVKDMELEALSK